MPSVKITFDVADAMKSLEDINQKIQEFADKCLIGHDAAAKLQNRMANKIELNLADSKNKAQETSTEKKGTDDNQGDNQKQPQDINSLLTDHIKKTWGDNFTDAAQLTGNYVAIEREKLNKVTDYMIEKGASEETIRNYSAQKQDEINKKAINGRMAHENNFSGFLSDKLSSDYGLYKTSFGKQTDLWNDYYKNIKTVSDNWSKDLNTGLSSTVFDALKQNGDKALQDWRDMLSGMNQDLIRGGLGMAQSWASAHIFKPMLGGVLGTDQTDNSYGVMGSLGAQQAASAGLQYGPSGVFFGKDGAPLIVTAVANWVQNQQDQNAPLAGSIFGTPTAGGFTFGFPISGGGTSTQVISSDVVAQANGGAVLMSAPGGQYYVVNTQTGQAIPAAAAAAQGAQTSSGLSLSSVLRNLGKSNTLYNLATAGSSGASGAAQDAWGIIDSGGTVNGSLTLTNSANQTVNDLTTDQAAWINGGGWGPNWTNATLTSSGTAGSGASSGIMGIAGPALAAGGLGYLAGNFIWPSQPEAGYIGAEAGANGLGSDIAGTLPMQISINEYQLFDLAA